MEALSCDAIGIKLGDRINTLVYPLYVSRSTLANLGVPCLKFDIADGVQELQIRLAILTSV